MSAPQIQRYSGCLGLLLIFSAQMFSMISYNVKCTEMWSVVDYRMPEQRWQLSEHGFETCSACYTACLTPWTGKPCINLHVKSMPLIRCV